jgi:RNA polymerase sigma-70 factor (ECF subfamily)
VGNSTKLDRFEQDVVQHLDAAYNLARWLTRSSQDAEDVVQEAFLRAFKYFNGYHGGNIRSWLLTIVRNTTYTWLQQNRSQDINTVSDDELTNFESREASPETTLIQNVNKETISNALAALPTEYREILVLRELEGLSYKEISDITEIPVGTVMSRLSRARKRLQQQLMGQHSAEVAK